MLVLGGQLADGTVLDKATWWVKIICFGTSKAKLYVANFAKLGCFQTVFFPKPQQQVELLDLQCLTWERLPPMPSPRSGGGCGLISRPSGSMIYVLGGLGASGLTVPVVDRFDLEAWGDSLGMLGVRKWGKCRKVIGKARRLHTTNALVIHSTIIGTTWHN